MHCICIGKKGWYFVSLCNKGGLALERSRISSPKAEDTHTDVTVHVAPGLLTSVSVAW